MFVYDYPGPRNQTIDPAECLQWAIPAARLIDGGAQLGLLEPD